MSDDLHSTETENNAYGCPNEKLLPETASRNIPELPGHLNEVIINVDEFTKVTMKIELEEPRKNSTFRNAKYIIEKTTIYSSNYLFMYFSTAAILAFIVFLSIIAVCSLYISRKTRSRYLKRSPIYKPVKV